MFHRHPRSSGGLVTGLILGSMLLSSGTRAADDWIECFDDGDVFDGAPIVWTPDRCTQCPDPTYFDATSGDLVLRSCEDKAVWLLSQERREGNVSLRFQARLVGEGELWPVVHLDYCGRCYCGIVSTNPARTVGVGLVRFDDGTPSVWNERAPAEIQQDEDYVVQVDRQDDVLRIRCWPAVGGSIESPVGDLIREDPTHGAGRVGIGFIGLEPDAHAVVRYLWASDEEITGDDPPCDPPLRECNPRAPVAGDPTDALWDDGRPVAGGIVGHSVTPDGLTLYFDEYIPPGDGASTWKGRIWKATRKSVDEPWTSDVTSLTDPETGLYKDLYPRIAPDGKWLYFISWDRPGTIGDMDIFAAKLNADGTFDRVIHVPDVNTSVGEYTGSVYSGKNGDEFYFTSERPGGTGTHDIWVGWFNDPGNPEAGFTDLRPLPDINTPNEASLPSVSCDGTMLFFSDRPQNWPGGLPPRPGGQGGADVWVALRHRYGDGTFGPWWIPERSVRPVDPFLRYSLNTGGHEFNPWVYYAEGHGWRLLFSRGDSVQRSDLREVSLDGVGCHRSFVRGKVNDDGSTDIADPVFVLNFLFLAGTAPHCEDAADADDNGSLEITDAVYLLNYLFLGGPAPATPFPDCGPDPTPDALTCESFPGCEEP